MITNTCPLMTCWTLLRTLTNNNPKPAPTYHRSPQSKLYMISLFSTRTKNES